MYFTLFEILFEIQIKLKIMGARFSNILQPVNYDEGVYQCTCNSTALKIDTT